MRWGWGTLPLNRQPSFRLFIMLIVSKERKIPEYSPFKLNTFPFEIYALFILIRISKLLLIIFSTFFFFISILQFQSFLGNNIIVYNNPGKFTSWVQKVFFLKKLSIKNKQVQFNKLFQEWNHLSFLLKS